MKIKIVRAATKSDIEKIIRVCNLADSSELQEYQIRFFTEKGDQKHLFTGFPETVLIAKTGNRTIGYLHFFTDCWDGYETHILSIGTDPSLSFKTRETIKTALKEEYRLTE